MNSFSIIGIGAAGVETLTEPAKAALRQAGVVIGSPRQLDLVAPLTTADRIELPRPLSAGLGQVLKEHLAHTDVALLASSDPTFYGIATTVRNLGLKAQIIPNVSSVSLACARLGWAQQHTEVYSLVTGHISQLIVPSAKGMPFLVLGRDATSPKKVRDFLPETTTVKLLSNLGAAEERIQTLHKGQVPDELFGLHIMAITPGKAEGEPTPLASPAPGMPDDTFDHDGQLTKQHIRAVTVSTLRPQAGDVLWDIGGGSGSIAIECLRMHANPVGFALGSPHQMRAVCFERDPQRAERIKENAAALGVETQLEVLGAAPEDFSKAPAPTVVFIGGGLTNPGVFAGAWEHLAPGGRLVANAVTLETKQVLLDLRKRYGGTLVELQVSTEHAVGGFTTLKPALGVTQWSVHKPC